MIATNQNLTLLQFLPTMAWTNLPNGEVTFYNKKWSDYTGVDMSKINTWAPESITYAEDAFVSGLFRDQLDKGVAFEIKNRYKHFNGQYRWHLNRFEPLKDESGKIYLWIGTAIDIEDKKRLEDELLQRNQKYEEGEIKFIKLIMQSTFAIAVYRGKELIAEIVNDAYFPIVGKTREEFIGRPLFESVPEIKDAIAPIIEEVIQTSTTFKVDEFGITMNKFGKDVFGYYSFIFEPVRDQQGKIDGIMTTAIDVTEKVLSRKAMEESEAHLQLLRDTVPAMIFYLDKEQRYQSYNGAFMEWFNVDAKSIIGKTVNEFLGEVAYNKTLPYLTKAYSGEQVKYEMAAPSRMGKPQWLSIVYTPHINNEGDILGIIVHATDISDSKKTEISLRESELRFRSLVNEAPVATCLFTGREMKIVVANEMILKEWGKDASVIGMRFEDAVPELKGQPFFDILDRVFTTGIAHSESAARAEVELDGVLTVSYYNFTFKPLFDENGEVYGIMDMAYNVTEQVETHKKIEAAVTERTRELAEANTNLQRSNAELEQFAHIASHDLQEPVRKISTYANMLEVNLGEKVDARSKVYLDKISISANRMGSLIRDVLSFSEVSHKVGPMVAVDFNQLIKEIEIDYELQIEKTGAVIEYKNLPTITAVPSQMLQLFSNLISNSLKYVNENVIPHIIVTATNLPASEVKLKGLVEGKKYYSIEFSDNGIGFDEHQKDQIFKIFQRLHGKTEFEGTGIGLALCRKIVYNHHGDISAKPGKNGGAVFTIILPA